VRIKGDWVVGSDGVSRPMVEVLLAGASVLSRRFLVDTGADVTVIRRVTLDALGVALPTTAVAASGIGGDASLVSLSTYLVLQVEGGGTARVNGPFTASLDPVAFEFDLLGRDVLNNFEVLVSRRRGEVLLLAPPHEYQVIRRQ
jgi:hypothetical protein